MPDGVRSIAKEESGAGGYEVVISLGDITATATAIEFFLDSPRGLPDGTSWRLTPVITGAGVPAVIGNTVDSTVTASHAPFQVALTDQGDKTYFPGQQVTWGANFSCDGNENGREWPQSFDLLITLPRGLDFVSSSAWTYDPATRTANLSRPGSLCGSASNSSFTLVTTASSSLNIGDELTSTVVVTAKWANGSKTDTSSERAIQIIDRKLPTGAFYLDASGPLRSSSDSAASTVTTGTFPGDQGRTSTYAIGASNVTGSDGDLLFAVSDDLPCLTERLSSFIFVSVPVGQLCAKPAWHLTQVVAGSGNAAFVGDSPTVTAVLVDGSTVTIPKAGGNA